MNSQNELRNFVANNIIQSQTFLVEELISQEIFSLDEVVNYYLKSNEEPQEIFEWWLVSDWLMKKLAEEKEPILANQYGEWWGRTTTGQAIFLDGVIKIIYDNYVI